MALESPQPPLIPEVRTLLSSIGIQASQIILLDVRAAYHWIYLLDNDLILRVSGLHLPKIKTENEVSILAWITQNTTIPVPSIVHYDISTENPLKHEYILMRKAGGATLADIYQELSELEIQNLLDELVDYLAQLHSHEWNAIGGLKFNEDGGIVPGPVLEETFWQIPDILRYWPDETVATLNIGGPFATYVDYITAHIQNYVYMIERHESLAFMRDLVPTIKQFLENIKKQPDLNRVKLRLAHKDLHFGNILYDLEQRKISCIIDWEFAGIVPFTRWNPVRAFLWNGQGGADSLTEKEALYEAFARRCNTRGVPIIRDAEYSSKKQESMQTAANYLRAITEVCPRGERQDDIPNWRTTFIDAMVVLEE
jgi:hypothetical protein